MFTKAVVVAMALASQFDLVQSTGSCTYYTMAFETLARSDRLTDQLLADYHFEAECTRWSSSQTPTSGQYGCQVFDTAIPFGGDDFPTCTPGATGYNYGKCGDYDLGSPNELCPTPGPGKFDAGHSNPGGGPDSAYPNCEPLGNVLIIGERGSSWPPDDNGNGGLMTFTFDGPAEIHQICFLDIDDDEKTFIDFFFTPESGIPDSLNNNAPTVGDNGHGCYDIDAGTMVNVKTMQIVQKGSGSVSDFTYTMCGDNHSGGGGGDPHIKRWNRKHFSFHGECDLVMLHSDEFHKYAGLDLHVRTTINDWYSYVESAALRVGDYLVHIHNDRIVVDGEEYGDNDLPLTFGGDFKYVINAPIVDEVSKHAGGKTYKVDLHENSFITFKVYKEFIFIDVSGDEIDFSDASGLLGNYYNGKMIDREGNVVYDYNQFGFEWQVRPEDGNLFADAREPQFPRQCGMPTVERTSRRLRGNSPELFDQAKTACASAADMDLCVDDVMATGDVGIAAVW